MNLVFFLVGVVTGGIVCYLYLQSIHQPQTNEQLAARVQTLEEQLVGITAWTTASLNTQGRPTRTRKLSSSPAKQERVLALYREGLECEKIAQETGVPLGQVELLTRLHGKE